MHPSPPLGMKTGLMVNQPWTPRKMLTIMPKFQRRKPTCLEETLACNLITLQRSNSSKWLISNTCIPSSKVSEVSIRCLRRQECHINSNHLDESRPWPKAEDCDGCATAWFGLRYPNSLKYKTIKTVFVSEAACGIWGEEEEQSHHRCFRRCNIFF